MLLQARVAGVVWRTEVAEDEQGGIEAVFQMYRVAVHALAARDRAVGDVTGQVVVRRHVAAVVVGPVAGEGAGAQVFHQTPVAGRMQQAAHATPRLLDHIRDQQTQQTPYQPMPP